jgi:hypothetical protein
VATLYKGTVEEEVLRILFSTNIDKMSIESIQSILNLPKYRDHDFILRLRLSFTLMEKSKEDTDWIDGFVGAIKNK